MLRPQQTRQAMSCGASKLLCAVIAGVLAGCGGGAGSSTGAADRPAAHARPASPPQETVAARPPAARVGRWAIRVRAIAPRSSGAVTFAAGPLRPIGKDGAEHELLITNTGQRPVAFADTRSSRLLGARGRREPLAGDEGCGYVQDRPGAAIELNACRGNRDELVVPSGRTATRTITLLWNLPGAGRLTPDTYVFRRPVRFAAGREAPDNGRGHAGVVRLVYTFGG